MSFSTVLKLWLLSLTHVHTQCFIYNIDAGLRSGGGIADVLEPASGDPNEFTRLFFDITFFFVVIVILLAIIQGGCGLAGAYDARHIIWHF